MAQIFPTDGHDTVVRKLAELIEKNNPERYQVESIASEQKPAKIGGVVPDIVLRDPSGEKAIVAIEVETAESISLQQALSRWKLISSKAPTFQVAFPKGNLGRVRRLCKRLGIKARFQEY